MLFIVNKLYTFTVPRLAHRHDTIFEHIDFCKSTATVDYFRPMATRSYSMKLPFHEVRSSEHVSLRTCYCPSDGTRTGAPNQHFGKW